MKSEEEIKKIIGAVIIGKMVGIATLVVILMFFIDIDDFLKGLCVGMTLLTFIYYNCHIDLKNIDLSRSVKRFIFFNSTIWVFFYLQVVGNITGWF